MEYRTAIMDECGCVVGWCIDMSDDEIDNVLSKHPEYSIGCVEV